MGLQSFFRVHVELSCQRDGDQRFHPCKRNCAKCSNRTSASRQKTDSTNCSRSLQEAMFAGTLMRIPRGNDRAMRTDSTSSAPDTTQADDLPTPHAPPLDVAAQNAPCGRRHHPDTSLLHHQPSGAARSYTATLLGLNHGLLAKQSRIGQQTLVQLSMSLRWFPLISWR